ncbi:MAG TPA: addiction module protein [Desulfuromonadales bacterium]|nr:addiction module protein [Desulfuromonadales bacterium]
MSNLARTVMDEALSLPPLERAGLIEELLASFDRNSRAAVDRAWAIEAERRIDDFDAGETTSISREESRARINCR